MASLRQQCCRDLAYTAADTFLLVTSCGCQLQLYSTCDYGDVIEAAGTVDTSFLAIAGLEGQVSNLQEALADAESASEQAVSGQQAAEKGAAEAQELRREVADLRKTLDDRQTELESIKACALTCWNLSSPNLSNCPCVLCVFCTQATFQDVANTPAIGFPGVYSDFAVLMSNTSILMLYAFVCSWQVYITTWRLP